METRRTNQQIFSLFLCNFAILFVGMGVFPLLPIYAAGFGASPSLIGVYLAITYGAITMGTMLTGWLSGRLSRKAVFVAAGALGVPALILLGQATALWQVVVFTSIVWFTGGIGIALVSVFIGLHASEQSRGKWFSLISLATPLGAIIGGSSVGWLVDRQGYPQMFAVLGLIYALWPLVGLFMVKDKPVARKVKPGPANMNSARPGKGFHLLLLGILLSAMTISVSRLGLSLSMKASQFSPAAIAGASGIGGLVTIPVVLGFGVLSDRLGRRLFLILGYLLAASSAITLVIANQLWHFWAAAAAMLLARSISGSLASALATDILPPEALSRGLPWLGTMTWVAGVLGFAASGYMIDTLGADNLYWIAAALSLAAATITGLQRERAKEATQSVPRSLRASA